MKALVIYDSKYGNTEKVATAVKDAIVPFATVQLVLASDVKAQDVQVSDIVFIGSPTQGGRPTEAIQDFIKSLPKSTLANKRFAVFDTRFAINDHCAFLKIVMKLIGFAAPKMATSLKKKGAVLLRPAEGFVVKDTEGPLEGKELAHAFSWAQTTYAQAKQQGVAA